VAPVPLWSVYRVATEGSSSQPPFTESLATAADSNFGAKITETAGGGGWYQSPAARDRGCETAQGVTGRQGRVRIGRGEVTVATPCSCAARAVRSRFTGRTATTTELPGRVAPPSAAKHPTLAFRNGLVTGRRDTRFRAEADLDCRPGRSVFRARAGRKRRNWSARARELSRFWGNLARRTRGCPTPAGARSRAEIAGASRHFCVISVLQAIGLVGRMVGPRLSQACRFRYTVSGGGDVWSRRRCLSLSLRAKVPFVIVGEGAGVDLRGRNPRCSVGAGWLFGLAGARFVRERRLTGDLWANTAAGGRSSRRALLSPAFRGTRVGTGAIIGARRWKEVPQDGSGVFGLWW